MLLEVVGQPLDPLVELSGVLGDSILHFVLDVESPDNEVVFGAGNAGTSVFLGRNKSTFFR